MVLKIGSTNITLILPHRCLGHNQPLPHSMLMMKLWYFKAEMYELNDIEDEELFKGFKPVCKNISHSEANIKGSSFYFYIKVMPPQG